LSKTTGNTVIDILGHSALASHALLAGIQGVLDSWMRFRTDCLKMFTNPLITMLSLTPTRSNLDIKKIIKFDPNQPRDERGRWQRVVRHVLILICGMTNLSHRVPHSMMRLSAARSSQCRHDMANRSISA
jgi:hypothetical protein